MEFKFKFKAGDKIRRRNGATFSNGECVVTVDRVSEDNNRIWIKETQSYIDNASIELYESNKNDSNNKFDSAIDKLNEIKEDYLVKISEIENIIKVMEGLK